MLPRPAEPLLRDLAVLVSACPLPRDHIRVRAEIL